MRKRAWTAIVLAGVVVVATVWVVATPSGPPRFVWTDGACVAADPRRGPVSSWLRLQTSSVRPLPRTRHDGCRALGPAQRTDPALRVEFAMLDISNWIAQPSVLRSVRGWVARQTTTPPTGGAGWSTLDKDRGEIGVVHYRPETVAAPDVDDDGVAWVRCELVPGAK